VSHVFDSRSALAEAAPRPGPPRDLLLCRALPADLPAIERTVRAAFGHELETRMIVRLERERRVTASVVALSAGRVVGHAMLSGLELVAGGAAWPALALAPVAVEPELQRRGIGSALVHRCLALAGPLRPVFVIGAPGFYGRFGFEDAAPWGVSSRFEPPAGHFLVRPAALPRVAVARRLEYPAAFGGP
jgi:putative acetyltransferase